MLVDSDLNWCSSTFKASSIPDQHPKRCSHTTDNRELEHSEQRGYIGILIVYKVCFALPYSRRVIHMILAVWWSNLPNPQFSNSPILFARQSLPSSLLFSRVPPTRNDRHLPAHTPMCKLSEISSRPRLMPACSSCASNPFRLRR